MKKIIIFLIAVFCAVIITGCQSEKTPAKQLPAPEKKASVAAKPENNKEEAKTITTKSGLKYKDKTVGDGIEVKTGDTVVVNYRGWLDDGTEFDSSMKPDREPFSFTVGEGRVIKGWDEGLVGMKKDGVRELTIPANLGYGSKNIGQIPANSTLHFEITLIGIMK